MANDQQPVDTINGKPVYSFNSQGQAVCFSPLRNKPGQFCQSPLPMDNGRCRIHGGKSLRGAAHPNFKHGRSSDYIPPELLKDFEEFLADPELRDLANEIAVLDTLYNTLLPRVKTGESDTRWIEIRKAWGEYKLAADEEKKAHWEAELERLIIGASDELAARREIGKLIDLRRKVVSADTMRRKIEQEMYTVEEVLTLTKACIAGVLAHVSNPNEQQAVIEAITRITRRASRSGGAAGDGEGRLLEAKVVSDDTGLQRQA